MKTGFSFGPKFGRNGCDKIRYLFYRSGKFGERGNLFQRSEQCFDQAKVVKQSRQVVLVAENQKFSKEAQYKGANYQDIDCFITDKVLTSKQQAYFGDQTEIIFEEETV